MGTDEHDPQASAPTPDARHDADEPPTAGQKLATEQPPATEQAAPGQQAPRRLVRLPDEGPLAGVSAGLAAYLNIDPVIVRIVFIVLIFAFLIGPLLYVALWIAMPRGTLDDVGQAAGPTPDQSKQWVGVALVAVAVLWLTAQADLLTGPLVLAFALTGVGALLLLQGRSEATSHWGHSASADPPLSSTGASNAPADSSPPAYAGPPPGGGATHRTASPTAPPTPAGPWPGTPPPPRGAVPPPPPGGAPPPPAPPSLLGRLTVAVILLALGATALLDNLGLLHPTPRHYIALLLLICGLGLVVGAWWGRSRGLIVVGALLVPLLLAVSALQALDLDGRGGLRSGIGERIDQPTSLEEVRDRYELGIGSLRVDLSAVDFTEPTTVRAHVPIGELVVIVPEDVTVDARARVGIGEVNMFGSVTSGVGRVERRVVDGRDAPTRLVLGLTGGVGEIRVLREGETPRIIRPRPSTIIVPED